MPNADLTNYAGLIILCIIIAVALLSCLGHRLYPNIGAAVSIVSAIVGCFVSMGIVNVAGFEDASLESVLTISIGTFLLPVLYNIIVLINWYKGKRKDRLQKKITMYLQEKNELEKAIKHNHAIVNLLTLLKCCGGDTENIEQHERLIVCKNMKEELVKN